MTFSTAAARAEMDIIPIPVPRDVCVIYTKCRALTSGEKKLAQSFYGHSINYNDVRIIKGRYLGLFPIGPYAGMSPDGNIYASSRSIQSGDYSQDKEKAHFFIHELFHIFQRNQGINILKQALSLHSRNLINPYRYEIKKDKALLSYNFEQQAKIVEHAYILGEYLRSEGRLYPIISQEKDSFAKACSKLRDLKKVIDGVVMTGTEPTLCR